MSEHPLDVLRESIEFVCDEHQQHPHPSIPLAALRAVEQLERAAREVVEQDWRELVLDPTWSQRILEPALAPFDRKEQT